MSELAPSFAEVQILRAKIERLRAALKPFAQFAEHTGGPSALIHEEWDVTVADAIRAKD